MANITELWTEKYRPKTVEEYVFKDEAQREQVVSWIKNKTIPHLLFSGSAGIGKCLVGTEEIIVKIDIDTLTSEQIEKLSQFKC